MSSQNIKYQTHKTTICRYIDIGCKIEKCRKAHSLEELSFSNCDCSRENCPFFHSQRDKHISKKEYFERMKNSIKILDKSNKHLLCRYIIIGCQRENCPYAHDIHELVVKKCIFSNCRSNCVYVHENETINKIQYFNKIIDFIKPFKPKSILCRLKSCNSNCRYAHSYNEFIVIDCIRGNNCKKHCCPFRHPFEQLDKLTYYNRMNCAMYPN